jgi:predicted peroxiredoxin
LLSSGHSTKDEVVHHINGKKQDNRLENLEWNTWGENQKHALDNGLKIPKKGESHPMVKLNKEIVLEAVKTSGLAIQFADESFKKDINILLAN